MAQGLIVVFTHATLTSVKDLVNEHENNPRRTVTPCFTYLKTDYLSFKSATISSSISSGVTDGE